MATRWDKSNWTPGKATVLGSLGFPWKLKYPTLQAPITAKAAPVSQPAPTFSGGPNPNQTQQTTPGGSGGGGSGGGSTPPAPAQSNWPPGTYSKAKLEAIWIAAGGNPAKANIAAAIALAESSGVSTAISPTADYGLWQINRGAHPSQWTLDPLKNARAAVAISSNGTNWQPWATYQKGLYIKYL